MTTPMPLTEVTSWLGGGIAIDEELFAVVGEWSIDELDAELRVAYATISRWLGEHAVAARGLLADSPALAAAERVAIPRDWVERLASFRASTSRRHDLESVLRDRIARDEVAGQQLSDVSDGPLLRHLTHTGVDLELALRQLVDR